MIIRDYDESIHVEGLRQCLIELQDFERSLDARLPPGRDIVDEYIPDMLDCCNRCKGKVLIALVDGRVAGYATILTKVKSEKLEDGDLEYGLISDLVVAEEFRRKGIGRRLLEEAESYAQQHQVRWLRIGVLAANETADELYASMGFSSWHIEREKDLGCAQ